MTMLPSLATLAESLWPFAARDKIPDTNSWSSSFFKGNLIVPTAAATDANAKVRAIE